MAKKSFKENNPVLQFITPPEETQEDQAGRKTRKLKKANEKNASDKLAKKMKIKEDDKEKKLPRIDKILTKDNFRYLKDITRSESVSVSDYINRLVNEDQAKRSAY